MSRRLLPLALVAACASKGGEGARGQGGQEVVLPEAPTGAAWRTARGVAWKEMLEDLSGADTVFVSGDRGLDLAVLDYLFKRGKLHAIGLHSFPRTAQAALDDFSFGRIDAAGLAGRCTVADADRPVLEFAAERRLPVLALGVERTISDAVSQGGLEALSEEQRLSLPAVRPADPARGELVTAAPNAGVVEGLRMDVAADVIVGWYRDAAPEGAQVAVLGTGLAPRSLPERLLARSGKTYRTLAAVEGGPEMADQAVFAKGYADYVWFTGDR